MMIAVYNLNIEIKMMSSTKFMIIQQVLLFLNGIFITMSLLPITTRIYMEIWPLSKMVRSGALQSLLLGARQGQVGQVPCSVCY